MLSHNWVTTLFAQVTYQSGSSGQILVLSPPGPHLACVYPFKDTESSQDPIQLMNCPPPPLATRRKREKLLLCRHILLGGSILPPSIFASHPHPSPRLHHCMALHHPNTRTSAHLHSLFPSTVKLWNELSSELVSLHTKVTF